MGCNINSTIEQKKKLPELLSIDAMHQLSNLQQRFISDYSAYSACTVISVADDSTLRLDEDECSR